MNGLSLLSSFAAVVKAGSFTKAAQRIGLSKSVVSRHVSALERQLGVQLLYRSTHKLSLTEAGERCYVHCKDLEELAERAVTVANIARETPRGLLRVTLPQTLVLSPVGRLLTRFQQRFPEVELDVRVTSLLVDPIEEGFDVALRIGDQEDSALVCRRICDVRFQTVAAPSYIKRHGRPRTVDELKAHNCLLYSDFATRMQMPERQGARRRPLALRGNFNTNSGVLLINALLAGQGIVTGPDLMFASYVRRGQVKVLFSEAGARDTALYALFPPGRFPTVSRTALVDFLIAELAAKPS